MALTPVEFAMTEAVCGLGEISKRSTLLFVSLSVCFCCRFEAG